MTTPPPPDTPEQRLLAIRKYQEVALPKAQAVSAKMSAMGLPVPDRWIEFGQQMSVLLDGNPDPTTLTVPMFPVLPYPMLNEYGWSVLSDISSLKLVMKEGVEIERERLNRLPITYNDSQFDADAVAQRNVSAWMTNIGAGQNPPTGFTWRGYDNVDHPADADFIVGLGNLITLRGSYLYQRSWIKKAEVDALTTAAAVKAYDVTTGW